MAGGGAVPDDGRRGEHPGCSWSACPHAVSGRTWSREEEKRREEKGKRKGKEKGEKERKGEKGGKEKKGGAGGIRGDSREPGVASTRSRAHAKRGEQEKLDDD